MYPTEGIVYLPHTETRPPAPTLEDFRKYGRVVAVNHSNTRAVVFLRSPGIICYAVMDVSAEGYIVGFSSDLELVP